MSGISLMNHESQKTKAKLYNYKEFRNYLTPFLIIGLMGNFFE